MAANGKWEELRRQVRRLEGEVENKLSSYVRLIASDASSRKSLADGLFSELELKIAELRKLNDSLQEHVNTQFNPPLSMIQVAERHREVLQEYQQELIKSADNIRRLEQREALFQSKQQLGDSESNRSDLLLKEHDHIKHSSRMTDEIINIAIDTRENLIEQRKTLSETFNTTDSVLERFPIINSLARKIQFKKRKDAFVLGGVIAVCLIILLFFLLR